MKRLLVLQLNSTLLLASRASGVAGLSLSDRPFVAASPRNTTFAINGEPKSGTTWLEYIVKALLVQGCTHAKGCKLNKHQRTVSAQTDSELIYYDWHGKHIIPHFDHIDAFDFRHPPKHPDSVVSYYANKTVAEDDGKKWLVMFRDPRDVAVSSCYHMYRDCGNVDGYVTSKVQSIAEWTDLRYRFFKAIQAMAPDRVRILFYESMRQDELGAISDLAVFLGVEVTDAQVSLISQRTTFSAMKNMSSVPQGGAASGKVRKGDMCGHKAELSPSVLAHVEEVMRSALSEELNAKWTC